MLTGQLRNEIDKLWEKFWTGGITNPLTVIEQISYLLFARMLDVQETTAERKAGRTGKPFTRLFPDTPEGQLLRWKNFKNLSGKELHQHLRDKVYPHFATLGQQSEKQDGLGSEGSGQEALGHIGEYMKDASLEVKNESVLVAALEMVEKLPLDQSADTKGDVYEYLLSKLTTAGINGQFRTPRHVIDFMIACVDPQVTEVVCDPACGTAGFLARTREYLKQRTDSLHSSTLEHINKKMFWGFDFDTTMLQVSSMNMMLHGVSGANIHYQDSLNKSIREHFFPQSENFFDVVLANPPFKGSLDESNTNPELLAVVKTKKTELLFVAHILRSLKLGGRAAVIVPDGVLFGSSKAHQQLRQALIDSNQLEGVVSLPSGVFKPYAGVSTAILLFTKGGQTDRVWFFDVLADGFSLDDKRAPVTENDLPSALAQWQQYRSLLAGHADAAAFGDKTQKAFLVDAGEIRANKYDLSINRYKEVVHEEAGYDDPREILQRLMTLEGEIMAELKELEGML